MDKPLAWREKLDQARGVLRSSYEAEAAGQDEEAERVYQAVLQVFEAIEEVGQLAEATTQPRKPRQRKSKGRDA